MYDYLVIAALSSQLMLDRVGRGHRRNRVSSDLLEVGGHGGNVNCAITVRERYYGIHCSPSRLIGLDSSAWRIVRLYRVLYSWWS